MAFLPENHEESPQKEYEEYEEELEHCIREEDVIRRRLGFLNGFIVGVAASFLCLLIFGGGWLLGQRAQQQKKVEQEEKSGASVLTDGDTLRKLDEVQSLIEQNYLDEVDSEELSTFLFKGVAAGLDDDYADYYSKQELESVLDSTRGEYFGIGAVLSENTRTGEICVIQVYEGSPAEKAGLQEGDAIMSVNDEAAMGLGLSGLVTTIKGMEYAFRLTVYRAESEEELELELKCDNVEIVHVSYEMLEGNTGYLKISEFTTSAVEQFRNAVADLNSQGMQNLIVDLRNNPGGLLTSVCDILDEVLPEGLIVYTEDKYGEREEFMSDGNRSVTCPLAVLVNGYSASASEIFAGAVQDYGLGPVIGTQTYGKGVVQKTYPLSDGSAFKVTVEKYFTAGGQDIDGNGITPDTVIEETETDEKTGMNSTEEKEEASSDPVLKRALEELGSTAKQ